MSGLLPRTEPSSGTGNFNSISTQTLVVSGTGFISNLVTTAFSPTSLNTSTINGNPSLTIAVGSPSTTALIFDSGGISNDNTTTRVLGLSPGDNATLVYKTNVADTSSVQTFTNKTLNSAGNTITITSGSLSGTNINSVLNQAVQTTSSPTFAALTLTTAAFHPIIVNNSAPTSGSDILFQNTGVNVVGFGADQSTNEAYAWVYANQPLKFGTNNSERLRIDAGGISNDNTITNILGLSGTSLRTKTNVADTSTAQTFSNKTLLDGSTTIANTSDTTKTLKFSLGGGAAGLLTTLTFAPQTVARALVFPDASDTVVVQNLAQTLTTKTLDSAGNTITITSGGLAGTNINSVLNQAVLTTSTPTFGITTISYATSQAGLVIDNTNTGVTTSGLVCRVNGTSTFNLGVNASTSESYLYTLTNVPIKFGTNNTERFRIDTAGAATYSNVTSVTQTIGGNNTFALGSKGNYAYSNANGAIFSGANNGDINLQNTDSTKGINIGVGSTTPQFNCNSSTITLAVSTVRQTIITNNTYALGTKSDYAYSSSAGAYFTSAAAGDINIRNTDTTKSLNLGVGSSQAQLVVGNALISTFVTLKPNVSADETATNWAAINGSGNLVTRAISSGRFTPTWTTTSGFTAGPVANQMNYNRVGNVVNCTGALTGMGLAVGGNAGTLTLPVAPASFAAALDCTGVVTASDAITSVPVTGFVSAVTSTTTVRLTVKDAAGSTGTVDLYYAFSYELS